MSSRETLSSAGIIRVAVGWVTGQADTDSLEASKSSLKQLATVSGLCWPRQPSPTHTFPWQLVTLLLWVAWLSHCTEIAFFPLVPTAQNIPLKAEMCQSAKGSGSCWQGAGACAGWFSSVQQCSCPAACSVPARLPSLSFHSPCPWLSAPLLALLLLDHGWRFRTVLVGVPAAWPAPGQAPHRAGASAGGADSCGWLCWAVAVTDFWKHHGKSGYDLGFPASLCQTLWDKAAWEGPLLTCVYVQSSSRAGGRGVLISC